MNRIVIIIFFATVWAGCHKTDDDLSGDSEITGKLYLQNIWDTVGKSLVSSNEVFVRRDTSQLATAFLSSTKSDKDGFFDFKYLYADLYYGLHSEMRANTALDNNVLFSADTFMKPGNRIELVMKPDLKKQNALFVTCVDTLNPVGVLSSVNVFIYQSRISAEADGGITGIGSYRSFVTKSNGTAFKMNLSYERELYVRAVVKIGSLTLKSAIKNVKLDATGMKPLELEMRQ